MRKATFTPCDSIPVLLEESAVFCNLVVPSAKSSSAVLNPSSLPVLSFFVFLDFFSSSQ